MTVALARPVSTRSVKPSQTSSLLESQRLLCLPALLCANALSPLGRAMTLGAMLAAVIEQRLAGFVRHAVRIVKGSVRHGRGPCRERRGL
jgi:hypothetical protein